MKPKQRINFILFLLVCFLINIELNFYYSVNKLVNKVPKNYQMIARAIIKMPIKSLCQITSVIVAPSLEKQPSRSQVVVLSGSRDQDAVLQIKATDLPL